VKDAMESVYTLSMGSDFTRVCRWHKMKQKRLEYDCHVTAGWQGISKWEMQLVCASLTCTTDIYLNIVHTYINYLT